MENIQLICEVESVWFYYSAEFYFFYTNSVIIQEER